MKRAFFPFAGLLLIGSALLSCQFNPSLQGYPVQNPVLKTTLVSDLSSKRATEQPNKILQLPSLVQIKPLDEPSEAQLREIKSLLGASSPDYQVTSNQEPLVNVLEFKTDAKNLKKEIKISENKSFRVIFEASASFKIIDGNTTDDGQAYVQMPQGTLDTLFHLQGVQKPTSQLDVTDSLYAVQDSLNSTKGRLFEQDRWFHLGRRPLPVPSNWFSPDGQKFVLSFKTSNVREFEMVTVRDNQAAPFPPGIAQIGKEGGSVELPGVARLVIPQGSLSQSTVISLRQETSAPEIKGFSIGSEAGSRLDYASAVIKMNPLGLALLKPAQLFLETDINRLGQNHPAAAHLYLNSDINNVTLWRPGQMVIPGTDPTTWPTKLPGLISNLSYAARLIPGFISPTDKYVPSKLEDSNGSATSSFTTQQVVPSTGQQSKFETFYLTGTRLTPTQKTSVKSYLDKLYSYYQSIFLRLGSDAVPKPSMKYTNPSLTQSWDVTPVFFRDKDAASGQTTLWTFDTGASDIQIDLEIRGNSIHIPSAAENIAHELWHAFQYAKLSGAIAPGVILSEKKEWIFEGAAEYMGARTMKEVPFDNLDMTLEDSAPPHYFISLRKNQQDMNVPIYERKEDPKEDGSITSRGYSTAGLFTYLADTSANLSGVDVLAKLAIHYHQHIFDNPFDALFAATQRPFNEIQPEFAIHTLTQDMYQRLYPAHSAPSVNVFGGRPTQLETGFTKANPMLIPGPIFQNWATTYFDVTPGSSLSSNQELYVKAASIYLYPLNISVIPYKNVLVNGSMVKNYLPPTTPVSVNGDYVKITNDFNADVSGVYISVSNVHPFSIDEQLIRNGPKPFFELSLATTPHNQGNGGVWMPINPNTLIQTSAYRPGLCRQIESDNGGLLIQTVPFNYVDPVTNLDETLPEPVNVSYTTGLGTRTYPVHRIVQQPTAPPQRALYVAWLDDCPYPDDTDMWSFLFTAVPFTGFYNGTFILEDALGRHSNAVNIRWRVH